MLTYKEVPSKINVYRNGEFIGTIKRIGGGYAYTPKNTRRHERIFLSPIAVKKSLEGVR